MGACLSRLKVLNIHGTPKKDNYAPDPTELPVISPSTQTSNLTSVQRVGSAGRNSHGVSTHQIELVLKAGRKVVRAMYDYVSAEDDNSNSEYPDLNFQKNDVMEILKEDGDWWLARNMLTGAKGYIPRTYVALEDGIDRFEWFHGKISRKDAERHLLNPGLSRGTFLVRESESSAGAFSLSILDVNPEGEPVAKHYKIRDLDDGGCYITTKRRCRNLEDLINHYQNCADGLCHQLTHVCPKIKPTMTDLSRETRDHWEIDRKTLVLQDMLGSGNFGEVYRGLWNNKTAVAVKTLKSGMMEVSKFLEEAAIMKQLRHRRLVTLFAVCSHEEPIYIVTELCAGGSLLSYLRSDVGQMMNFPRIIDIATQVAEGMMYIESKNYIHRDLAARNILVTENLNVKIGDFGLARAINEDVYTPQPGAKFPIKWTAPEAASFGRFTIKADVWSYGILLVELVTHGQTPYAGMSNNEVLTQLERGYRHLRPRDCPEELYDIMKTCWKAEPNERPTFNHLYNTMDDYSAATQSSYAESLQ